MWWEEHLVADGYERRIQVTAICQLRISLPGATEIPKGQHASLGRVSKWGSGRWWRVSLYLAFEDGVECRKSCPKSRKELATYEIWREQPHSSVPLYLLISFFIRPESDHCLPLSLTDWLTHWLTDSCLVNLIDVTLACEDTNSKLFDVVTVADVDDEDRVGNSLLQI